MVLYIQLHGTSWYIMHLQFNSYSSSKSQKTHQTISNSKVTWCVVFRFKEMTFYLQLFKGSLNMNLCHQGIYVNLGLAIPPQEMSEVMAEVGGNFPKLRLIHWFMFLLGGNGSSKKKVSFFVAGDLVVVVRRVPKVWHVHLAGPLDP